MDRTRRLLGRSLPAAGLVAALLLGGCSPSGNDAADGAVTVTMTTQAGSGVTVDTDVTTSVGSGGPVVVAPPIGSGGETASGTGTGTVDPAEASRQAEQAAKEAAAEEAAAKKKAAAEKKKQAAIAKKKAEEAKKRAIEAKKAKRAQVTIRPADATKKVEPLQKIRVASKDGKLSIVRVFNPEGKIVYHGYRINAKKWSVEPKLGYGRTYTVIVDSVNKYGRKQQDRASFTTKNAKTLVSAQIFPSNGKTVGVGQPIRITFSEPIKGSSNKLRVQNMITVKTTDTRKGKFHWFSDTEVRWRPKNFFMSRAHVGVKVDIYGHNLGNGAYGAADVDSTYYVGRKMVSVVDARTHTMVVKKDNRTIRTMKVSLGNDKYPTYNGVHIVTEKHKRYTMDSSTWGLEGAGAYVTKVKWATRISNSGEFVHGAPWSEWAQGNTNVSHGCINVTDANAKWYQQVSLPGDVLIVKGSSGPKLKSYDGYGDWNLPFNVY